MDLIDYQMSFLGVFLRYLELSMSEWHVLRLFLNIRRNRPSPISTNVLGLRLIWSHFSKLVDHTIYRKSLLGVFPRYLELPTSERRVLGGIGTIRGNPMKLNSTNMSQLWLIRSQFSKLVDWIDCRKVFLGCFSAISRVSNVKTMCFRIRWKC